MTQDGYPTLQEWREHDERVAELCKLLKCQKKDIPSKIKKLQERIAELEQKAKKLEEKKP